MKGKGRRVEGKGNTKAVLKNGREEEEAVP